MFAEDKNNDIEKDINEAAAEETVEEAPTEESYTDHKQATKNLEQKLNKEE